MRLVFASSTFVDMQQERDLLHSRISPYLDNALSQYGERAYFGDLRWGVDTSELSELESSKKVLSSCLDEIDGCKPYMIVFIGERYGWIPQKELLKEAALLKGIEINEEMSVTELEIEYGALLNPDLEGRIIFYFRELDKSNMSEEDKKKYEAESSEHKTRIFNLKERIKSLYPQYVRTYKAKWDAQNHRVIGLEDFERQVEKDLLDIFEKDLGSQKGHLDIEQLAINNASRRYLENAKFYTPLALPEYTKPLLEEQKVFLIKGEEKSGKTFYLSHFYENLYKNHQDDVIIIPYIHQLDPFTKDSKSLLLMMLYKIRENLGYSPHEQGEEELDVDSLVDKFIDLLDECEKPVYVIADECDEDCLVTLFKIYKSFESAGLLLKIPCYQKLDIYFACKNGTEEPAILPGLEYGNIISLPKKIPQDSIHDYIRSIARFNRKVIPDELVKFIALQKQANNPLYLNTLLDRLVLLDAKDFQLINQNNEGTAGFIRYCENLIYHEYKEIGKIITDLLRIICERVDRKFAITLLTILTYSRCSFSKAEIQDIFKGLGVKFSELDFTLIIRGLQSLFTVNRDKDIYKLKDNHLYVWSLICYLEDQVDQIKDEYLNFVLSINEKDYPTLYSNRFNVFYYGNRFDLCGRIAKEALNNDIHAYRKSMISKNIVKMILNENELGAMCFKQILDTCSDIDMTYYVRMIPARFLSKEEVKTIEHLFEVLDEFYKEKGTLNKTQRLTYAYISLRKAVFESNYYHRERVINTLKTALLLADTLDSNSSVYMIYMEWMRLFNEVGMNNPYLFGMSDKVLSNPFKALFRNDNEDLNPNDIARLVSNENMEALEKYYYELTRNYALFESGRLLLESNIDVETGSAQIIKAATYLLNYLQLNPLNDVIRVMSYEDYIHLSEILMYCYPSLNDYRYSSKALDFIHTGVKHSNMRTYFGLNTSLKSLIGTLDLGSKEFLSAYRRYEESEALAATILNTEVEYSKYLEALGWELFSIHNGDNFDRASYIFSQFEKYLPYVKRNVEDNPTLFYDAYFGLMYYVLIMKEIDQDRCYKMVNNIVNEMMQDTTYPLLMTLFINHLVVVSGFGNSNHVDAVINAYNIIMNDRTYNRMVRKYNLIFEQIKNYYS